MPKNKPKVKEVKQSPSQRNTLKKYFQTEAKKKEVDSRPFCKYGATCYQKNEEHLKKYQHVNGNQNKSPKKNESAEKRKTPISHSVSSFDSDEAEQSAPKFKKAKITNQRKSPVTSEESDNVTIEESVSTDDDTSKEKSKAQKSKIKPVINRLKKMEKPEKVSDDESGENESNSEIVQNKNEIRKSTKPENDKNNSRKTARNVLGETELKPSDLNDIIENIYGVKGMPTDFFHFWKFCSTLTPSNPTLALKDSLGFKLVGPFEILLNPEDFQIDDDEAKEDLLCKYRYYYDPPEFQTCVVSLNHEDAGDEIKDEKMLGFHLGYYRDDPESKSSFVALNTPGVNYGAASYKIQPMGDNLFGAICSEIAHRLQQLPKSDGKRDGLEKIKNRMRKYLNDRDLTKTYSLDRQTQAMKSRQKSVVAKCFHGAGISVRLGVDDIGYRELPVNDSKLLQIFTKISNNKDNPKKNINEVMVPVQEIINLVQFANDECDFGMGLELGHDLFSYGDPVFHSSIKHVLPLAYDLLNRSAYGRILIAHLKRRDKMCGSSHWHS